MNTQVTKKKVCRLYHLGDRARKLYRPYQNESAILRRPNRLSARKQTSREPPCGQGGSASRHSDESN